LGYWGIHTYTVLGAFNYLMNNIIVRFPVT
jgi:hypothetical protein